jgi:hypothetical protein
MMNHHALFAFAMVALDRNSAQVMVLAYAPVSISTEGQGRARDLRRPA